MMRFHILGLPHTVTNKDYVACAYTQKVLKFAKMMRQRGHYIIHYGHEDSYLDCDEHVTVVTNDVFNEVYGTHDWRKNFFKYDLNDKCYKTFYHNAIREIQNRKQYKDFLLPFWGTGHKPICDAHNDMIVVEPGIGYPSGHFARWKIFESYAIYHAYYGLKSVGECKQDWYDVVIPNYFDPDDFEYSAEKDDYMLFIGRVYEGKGVNIAIQATEKTGDKLIIAGQNTLSAMGYKETPKHVECIGFVDIETRKRLMARAKGGYIASLYNEPFGGVQIEMLFSGTPTITTDWGAFTENNIHGVTGYRCRTFDQFVWATKNINKISSEVCRQWAIENFSLEKVGYMYEEYFDMVLNVHGNEGWYEFTNRRWSSYPAERTELNWLKKSFPEVKETFDHEEMTKEEKNLAKNTIEWIDNTLSPKTFLDIGCGPGSYVAAYSNKNLNVFATGIDIDKRVFSQTNCFLDNLLELNGKRTAEVVMCLEVAEHIDPRHADTVVSNVFQSILPGGYLIWSAAKPGQSGIGHINCRPKKYWVDKFVKLGLIVDDELKESLFESVKKESYLGWFIDNVVIMKKDVWGVPK